VGKVFTGETRSDIGSEADKMKFANGVNNLVSKFIKLEINQELQADMLVMERIFPMDYRAYEVGKRELWMDLFRTEILELHRAGFVHRDLRRPSNIQGDRFDNILLTDKGLRLIDVGISVLKSQVSEQMFDRYIKIELEELAIFEEYFLNR
jgi:serine/threonine protein kinase